MHSILIVDDEKDNLDAIFRLLRTEYLVETTSSSFDALKKIQQKEYSLVISDQRMPEMSGVELLEKARAVHPNTSRILLTGYTDLDSVVSAINRGHIYHYIAKPWDPEDFKIIVKKALEHFQLTKELEQALENLKLLDKAKARFLSLISHELNTPLTVLESFMQLLVDSKKELPAGVQKTLDHLQKSVGRFSEIVQEVVHFVGTESQTLAVKESHISEDITFAFNALKKEINEKKIQIKNAVPSTAALKVDRGLFAMGFRKIVEEVVRYAKPGSLVEVGYEQPHIKITFNSPDFKIKSIDSFVSHQEQQHHSQDLGLKLATAKFALERLGYHLELTNDAKSHNVEFLIKKSDT